MLLYYLNSKHPRIKFTCELEQNNSLNYLDINLYKYNNHITTSIYRKPTYTGIGLNWFDGSPIHYKINSIKTLLHRAYNLTSSYINFHKEVEELLSYFKKNCYPPTMFYKILKQFLFKRYIEKPIRFDVPKEIIYIKVPFYGKISFNIRNKLQKLLNNSFQSMDFRFVFVNNFRIGTFFNIKDKIPDKVCSNICYEFICPSCNARYVGCSTRAFHIRVLEHAGKSYRTNQILSSPSFSAVRDHARENDHQFSINNFKIIAKLNSGSDTLIAERILIEKLEPEINKNI